MVDTRALRITARAVLIHTTVVPGFNTVTLYMLNSLAHGLHCWWWQLSSWFLQSAGRLDQRCWASHRAALKEVHGSMLSHAAHAQRSFSCIHLAVDDGLKSDAILAACRAACWSTSRATTRPRGKGAGSSGVLKDCHQISEGCDLMREMGDTS